jgi:hypothetical protein
MRQNRITVQQCVLQVRYVQLTKKYFSVYEFYRRYFTINRMQFEITLAIQNRLEWSRIMKDAWRKAMMAQLQNKKLFPSAVN